MNYYVKFHQKMTIHILYPVLLVLFLSTLLAACQTVVPTQDPAVKLAEYNRVLGLYNQLEVGMSYDQATTLFGTPYKVETPTGSTPHPNVPQFPGLTWKFLDGQIVVSYIIYEGGSSGFKTLLFSTSLSPSSEGAVTTTALYDTVKVGMTYDEVKGILGSAGRMVSSHYDLLPGVPKIEVNGLNIKSIATIRTSVRQMYYWWPEGTTELKGAMSVSFTNGVVTSKSYNGKTVTQ